MKQYVLPDRILRNLLFTTPYEAEWIDVLEDNQVRIYTPEACRDLRMDSAILWKYLYWLVEHGYLESVNKEQKRGTAIIKLKVPPNLLSLTTTEDN